MISRIGARSIASVIGIDAALLANLGNEVRVEIPTREIEGEVRIIAVGIDLSAEHSGRSSARLASGVVPLEQADRETGARSDAGHGETDDPPADDQYISAPRHRRSPAAVRANVT